MTTTYPKFVMKVVGTKPDQDPQFLVGGWVVTGSAAGRMHAWIWSTTEATTV